jgi:predicted Fe-S protein YdhL (DUF1289 family)
MGDVDTCDWWSGDCIVEKNMSARQALQLLGNEGDSQLTSSYYTKRTIPVTEAVRQKPYSRAEWDVQKYCEGRLGGLHSAVPERQNSEGKKCRRDELFTQDRSSYGRERCRGVQRNMDWITEWGVRIKREKTDIIKNSRHTSEEAISQNELWNVGSGI